jgi:hypothetical protein
LWSEQPELPLFRQCVTDEKALSGYDAPPLLAAKERQDRENDDGPDDRTSTFPDLQRPPDA